MKILLFILIIPLTVNALPLGVDGRLKISESKDTRTGDKQVSHINLSLNKCIYKSKYLQLFGGVFVNDEVKTKNNIKTDAKTLAGASLELRF